MVNSFIGTFAGASNTREWTSRGLQSSPKRLRASFRGVALWALGFGVFLAGCTATEPTPSQPDPAALEKQEREAKAQREKERDRQAIQRLTTATGADKGWESFLESDNDTPAFTVDFQESLAPRIGQRILVVGHLDDVIRTPSGIKLLCSYYAWHFDRWTDTHLVFVVDLSDALLSKLRAEMKVETYDDEQQIGLIVVPRKVQAILRRELRAFVEVEEGEQGEKEAEVQEGNLRTILRIDGECIDFAYIGSDLS